MIPQKQSPRDVPVAPGVSGPEGQSHGSFWGLTLGSIVVVYGDIGTSPHYALIKALTTASAGAPPSPESVVGVVSLILWTLLVIVTIKYVVIMLRADNNGEGGTLTLMALAQRAMGHKLLFIPSARHPRRDALLWRWHDHAGHLRAVSDRGLSLVTPAFDPYVLPLSLGILVGLFAVPSFGTASVARWFGPVTVFWFVVLAAGGLPTSASVRTFCGRCRLCRARFSWSSTARSASSRSAPSSSPHRR